MHSNDCIVYVAFVNELVCVCVCVRACVCVCARERERERERVHECVHVRVYTRLLMIAYVSQNVHLQTCVCVFVCEHA